MINRANLLLFTISLKIFEIFIGAQVTLDVLLVPVPKKWLVKSIIWEWVKELAMTWLLLLWAFWLTKSFIVFTNIRRWRSFSQCEYCACSKLTINEIIWRVLRTACRNFSKVYSSEFILLSCGRNIYVNCTKAEEKPKQLIISGEAAPKVMSILPTGKLVVTVFLSVVFRNSLRRVFEKGRNY